MRIEIIESQIECNAPIEEIKANIKKLLSDQHKQYWKEQKEQEYNDLFPSTREMTDNEKANYYAKEEREEGFIDFDFPLVKVEKEISFVKWINEEKIVQEKIDPTYDNEGNVLTLGQEEIKELLSPYEPMTTEELEKQTLNFLYSNETYLKNAKKEALKVLDITALPNGLRFYTDDKSMIDLFGADRKAERLGASDEDITDWKTPDGVKVVTIGDIREAIDLRLDNKGKLVGVESED